MSVLPHLNILHHFFTLFAVDKKKMNKSTNGYDRSDLLSRCYVPGFEEHFHPDLISQSGPDYWGFVVVVCRALLLQLFYHDKDLHICQPVAQSAAGRLCTWWWQINLKEGKCLQGCSKLYRKSVQQWKSHLSKKMKIIGCNIPGCLGKKGHFKSI